MILCSLVCACARPDTGAPIAAEVVSPPDHAALMDIVVENNLHVHGATQQGVVFHLMGALSEFGKLGVMCVADTIPAAEKLYRRTVEVLNREARIQAAARGAVSGSEAVVDNEVVS